MCWMTRCVMNARVQDAVGSLLPFSVPMSLACSITVSFAGRTSILGQDVNSISHWLRKGLTALARSTSAGTELDSSRSSIRKEECMWPTVFEETDMRKK